MIKHRWLAVFAAFAPTLGLCYAQSLEQFLTTPFSMDLVAAGNRAAWVSVDRGVRNVWLAEAPDWKGRALTRYTADDGIDIGQLALTPAGVVFTRGGDIETFRDIPNPGSLPVGPEQAIWLVPFAGGEPPKKLADGAFPVVSPSGDRLLFTRAGQVFATTLDSGAKPPELLLYTKMRAGGVKFSHDGSRIAFVSNRGDHAFVAIYSFATKQILYLDPSVDRDAAPVWSPDDTQVAFVRVAAKSGAALFAAEREAAEPWSIRVANAATGVGREVWRADRGVGSVFAPVDGPLLVWTADGNLIFPWEKTGWRHLYAIPAAGSRGGKARDLTPGEFEVEHVSAMAGGRGVLYSSNQGDIDRRHIWSVSASADAKALTAGTGIEWSPVQAGDGTVLVLRSSAKLPARPSVVGAPGGSMRDVTSPDYPAAQAMVDPKPVVFTAADGMQIHSQLFLPPGHDPNRKYPAITFYHGGSRRQMLLGFHYMGYYAHDYAMNQYLANRGYIVLSVNYRSGTGYGMEFREAVHYGATGASEFQDVQGAALYLRGRPDVDPRRIGVYGGSYGGYLTAMALSRASDLYAAGVDLHGVHDWNSGIRNFVPSYNPSPEVAKLAFESSPLASVSTWRSPVLLIHGDDDRNVNFNETVRLVEALRKQKVEVEQLVLPDEVHDFLMFRTVLKAMAATEEFLARRLK